MSDGYDGAGDGQCKAIKADGERCTNGTYGSNDLCGTHMNASDVETVDDELRADSGRAESNVEVHHWSVKVYEDGEERETIRGLTSAQKHTLMRVFDREGVHAHAMGYSDDGKVVPGESETVNRGGLSAE